METIASNGPIKNETVGKNNPGVGILCQGSSLCQFGDTFCFYGWGDYPGNNHKDMIIRQRNMTDLTLLVPDRLRVFYNNATHRIVIGKHILSSDDPLTPDQRPMTGGVSSFASSAPTGAFARWGRRCCAPARVPTTAGILRHSRTRMGRPV